MRKKNTEKAAGTNGQARVEETRRRLRQAFAKRLTAARDEALEALRSRGVPDLFDNADLVLKELEEIRDYTLNRCPDGVPQLQPFTASLVTSMLTVSTWLKYDGWALKDPLSDEEILQRGAFRDEDDYLAVFCIDQGDGYVFEPAPENAVQRRVMRAFSDYVRTSAAYAKEIGAKASAENWLRAFNIILTPDLEGNAAPYRAEALERAFGYIDEAVSELYVAWMYPKLPTLEQLRQNPEA